jgi:hypothetical protein
MFDCKKVSTSISIISSLWLILDPNSPESSYYWLYHLYNSNLHQFILVYHHLKPQCFRRYRFFLCLMMSPWFSQAKLAGDDQDCDESVEWWPDERRRWRPATDFLRFWSKKCEDTMRFVMRYDRYVYIYMYIFSMGGS